MRFVPGETVLRRGFSRGDRLGHVDSGRVVVDNDHGVLAWIGPGSTVLRRATVGGQPVRKMPFPYKTQIPTVLRPGTWTGGGVLVLTRPGQASSVWWFFDENGAFLRWYVNLEAPAVRWRDADGLGLDTVDHALDMWVNPDLSWEWKDEDEFADRTGHPYYWDDDVAVAIRAEGERVAKVAESGEFPFDGTWCDFKPDPAWPPSRLSTAWDRPRVRA
jgi:hypothetical protein